MLWKEQSPGAEGEGTTGRAVSDGSHGGLGHTGESRGVQKSLELGDVWVRGAWRRGPLAAWVSWGTSGSRRWRGGYSPSGKEPRMSLSWATVTPPPLPLSHCPTLSHTVPHHPHHPTLSHIVPGLEASSPSPWDDITGSGQGGLSPGHEARWPPGASHSGSAPAAPPQPCPWGQQPPHSAQPGGWTGGTPAGLGHLP